MHATLKIKFKTIATPRASRLAAANAKPTFSVDSSGPIIFFSSSAHFEKFFTPQKIALLSIIKLQAPTSIYHLALLAQRKFPAVFNDVKSLVHHGFLSLVKGDDKRQSLQPRLAFDFSDIVVENKHNAASYRISLKP